MLDLNIGLFGTEISKLQAYVKEADKIEISINDKVKVYYKVEGDKWDSQGKVYTIKELIRKDQAEVMWHKLIGHCVTIIFYKNDYTLNTKFML